MCCFIFNNKYFQFYVHYTTCCYCHLGRIIAILDGSKFLSFTLIILAIPPTWLALPPTWLVLLCFYLHYFQLIYLIVLPLPTMCPLPHSLYDLGGANDSKKGTQQQNTKVSGRHRQRDREHNTTITGQKRVALIPFRGHSIESKSTVI